MLKNETNNVYGKLTVVSLAKVDKFARWNCVCECGNEKIISGISLRAGYTNSCGCLFREVIASGASTTHGLSKTYWYRARVGMIRRCYNNKYDSYEDYGGRGITVCDRWRFGENGKSGVECLKEDLGERPSTKHSIDRKNVNGNYEPDNCEWADSKTQANNKRPYMKIGRKSLKKLARELNISEYTLASAIEKVTGRLL